jgi:60 kDa SS-A/Ro ribonucleoprotein
LADAMEIAIENVPVVDGRVVVCPDVSGSMQSPATGLRKGATSVVRCIDVAALVAAAFVRRNRDAMVLPFSDNVVPVKLDARAGVIANAKTLASLPSGGTNCSAPLKKLADSRERVDLVVIVSDNQSWMDSQPGATATMKEWSRVKAINPAARLVCVDIQPYGTAQAKEREDILNIGGFSDAVFGLVADFAAGRMAPGHWSAVIDAVEI